MGRKVTQCGQATYWIDHKNGILHKKLDTRHANMLDATIMFIGKRDRYMRADVLGCHAWMKGRLGARSNAHLKGLSPRFERKRTR
jgi:hypothetical protein